MVFDSGTCAHMHRYVLMRRHTPWKCPDYTAMHVTPCAGAATLKKASQRQLRTATGRALTADGRLWLRDDSPVTAPPSITLSSHQLRRLALFPWRRWQARQHQCRAHR